MAFMFKIIDEKKRIVGDPKKDNLILFVKVKGSGNGLRMCVQKDVDNMYLAMASLLLDEGYTDSFDRCFKAIMCC